MNKENKKMAQERRAAERRKKEAMRITRNVVIAAVVVALFAGVIIYGAIDSKKAKEQEASNAGANDTYQMTDQDATQEEPTLDTDPERTVEDGDTVAIHYAGSVDGIAFQGGTGDFDLLIGSHSFIDDFEEQLIGHHIGETVEVRVTFPDGYEGTYVNADGETLSLSNVEADFVVDIKGIY